MPIRVCSWSLACIRFISGIRFIRFVPRQLQIKPLEVQLSDVAGIVTVVINLHWYVPVVAEIVLRQLQSRFGQHQVSERFASRRSVVCRI